MTRREAAITDRAQSRCVLLRCDELLITKRPRFEILGADYDPSLADRPIRPQTTGPISTANRVDRHANASGGALDVKGCGRFRPLLGHAASLRRPARGRWWRNPSCPRRSALMSYSGRYPHTSLATSSRWRAVKPPTVLRAVFPHRVGTALACHASSSLVAMAHGCLVSENGTGCALRPGSCRGPRRPRGRDAHAVPSAVALSIPMNWSSSNMRVSGSVALQAARSWAVGRSRRSAATACREGSVPT